jgi:hypothetical protein
MDSSQRRIVPRGTPVVLEQDSQRGFIVILSWFHVEPPRSPEELLPTARGAVSGGMTASRAAPPSQVLQVPSHSQKSGRLEGTPTLRGNLGGQARSWRIVANAKPLRTHPVHDRPSWPIPSSGHRLGSPSGGSETTRTPPVERNGAAHSAVTAGGPKLLATTAPKLPRRSGTRAASSALSLSTAARPSSPSRRSEASRKPARRAEDSSRRKEVSSISAAMGIPGRPAPLPRSSTRFGVLGRSLRRIQE